MSDVRPDNQAAEDFLLLWAPEGPWVLTAIRPDKKAITTRTFYPSDLPGLRKYLQEHNGQRNVYFQVNPPIKDLKVHAEREDIKEMAWLHIDIDPRVGEDLESERERALALLTSKLPRGVPLPTVVVFSGGGYQGFWKLESPVPLNGEIELLEDAKRYNQQLEVLFSADQCHNLNRIMRLPGTINLPDAKKAAKGRHPELAKLVSFEADHVYPISDFTKAPLQQAGGGLLGGSTKRARTSGGKEVSIPDELSKLGSVDELDQWQIPDRLKIIAVQGRHPDEPKEDNSRSSWVFDFCCNMARREVPDEIILSILLDKDFGISESVLEKGSNALKYATRQLERAKEHIDDPELRLMNEKHAVIGNFGGKCRIIEEVYDPGMKRSMLSVQSFEDFRNRYGNRHVQIGVDDKGKALYKPLGKWWIDHGKRRQFETVVFAPNSEPDNAYNLWKGFTVQAVPGDCELFMQHVRDNVCGGDEKIFHYVICWLALCVQYPAQPGHVALVLRGGRGTGKTFFVDEVGKLFGRHYLSVSNSGHLVGNFNAHLRDVLLLFADEAFYAGDKKHASVLKTLITGDTLPIEAKGVDLVNAPNYVHLIMASNEQHVVPAGGDERRFLVLDVVPNHQKDHKYFGAIAEQMDNGGREALLHFLLNKVDVSPEAFNVRDVPETNALRDQKDLTLSPEEEWWLAKLDEGRLMDGTEAWPKEVLKMHLVDDFLFWSKRFMVSRRSTEMGLSKFLERVVPNLQTTRKTAHLDIPAGDGFTRKVKRDNALHYAIADLDACRKRWDHLHGARPWEPVRPSSKGGEDPNKPPF